MKVALDWGFPVAINSHHIQNIFWWVLTFVEMWWYSEAVGGEIPTKR
jgi:hypothetical protein